MAEFTPMMKQYLQIKEEYKDCILFYRLGDFYEMFFEDAKLASSVLDLVLTGKACGQEERAPMCGVPFHSADNYIARLVSHGYKVAICEQMEDPALAKGLVSREVVRIITPGTVIESNMLEEGKNNYLACLCYGEGKTGISFIDISTGTVSVTEVEETLNGERSLDELGRFSPRELLVNAQAAKLKSLGLYREKLEGTGLEQRAEAEFDLERARETVEEHFGRTTEEMDLTGENAIRSLGAALTYLYEVQKNDLANLLEIHCYTDSKYMKLDFSARRNLELTETLRNREKRGTLLWILDKTKTAMGKRLLRSYLEQPLVSIGGIVRRQNAVAFLVDQMQIRDQIADCMIPIHDMERLITRISYGTANARELRSLYETLSRLAPIKALLQEAGTELLQQIEQDIDPLTDLMDLIDSAITDDPPFSVREGGMIKNGYHQELDELREIVQNGRGFLATIEAKEREKTGIAKLKIGYNRVFGYYIEVPNAAKAEVPESYIRKQTLANAERYITGELKELEAKVLGAQDRIVKLEHALFSGVREQIAAELVRIQITSHAVASLDVLCSFAKVAVENNYICPEMAEDGVIRIKDGRHPVVEKMLKGNPFVPNDTFLDPDERQVALITGPNMAGKSTYMRQVALIVILAQIGSFVPASAAHLSVCDSIFTRVGASDDLASGQSTFMVEMSEVAGILKNATKNSLIILDEIGRGTSTFDGMSIARAVLEYVCKKNKIGAKTLFATHYHELTELEAENPSVKNYNIACKKRGDDIIFLRRIVPGPADGSYGIEVAKLAGVPNAVVKRAKEVLNEILSKQRQISLAEESASAYLPAAEEVQEEAFQMSFSEKEGKEILDTLKTLDVNTLTPIEALQTLYTLCDEAKKLED